MLQVNVNVGLKMKSPLPPRPVAVEKYLGIPKGSFDHIPHYAREQALFAIKNVMRMERKQMFRPGLYYIVLSDLCRSTATSASLGHELNKHRVETFILTCIEALGCIEPRNYFLPVREIGDAVLIIFSSFADVHDWWRTSNSLLGGRNWMWSKQMTKAQFSEFRLEAKTVVHSGEVDYSDGNIPVAQAVNEVFKVEKLLRAHELGVTDQARQSISPILKDLRLHPKLRGVARLPGSRKDTAVYIIDKNKPG
jgi:class 3 adenylate cyclase